MSSGSDEAPSKKIYRRADIIKLMQTDPDKYDMMQMKSWLLQRGAKSANLTILTKKFIIPLGTGNVVQSTVNTAGFIPEVWSDEIIAAYKKKNLVAANLFKRCP